MPPAVSPSVIKKNREYELFVLQKLIPHFTIRAIKALEDLRDEGVIDAEEFKAWVKPDYYKQINNQIYRVVSSFRQLSQHNQHKSLYKKLGASSSVTFLSTFFFVITATIWLQRDVA